MVVRIAWRAACPGCIRVGSSLATLRREIRTLDRNSLTRPLVATQRPVPISGIFCRRFASAFESTLSPWATSGPRSGWPGRTVRDPRSEGPKPAFLPADWGGTKPLPAGPVLYERTVITMVGLISNVHLKFSARGEGRNARVRHQKRSGRRRQAHGMLAEVWGVWSPAPTRK